MKFIKTQKIRSPPSSSPQSPLLSLEAAVEAVAAALISRTVSQKQNKTTTFSLPLVFLLIFIVAAIIVVGSVGCVVVYQVRFIATKNGRTDYALAGESIELSCHYIMKDEAEDVKQLVWSKDGKNFLRWRKHKPGLEILSYTFKGHVDPLSKHSHITIHNVTIGMHGKYKCSVKTDLGTHEMEQDLVVISQSQCKLNDWRVTSQPSECRELFKLDCRNMFPKPVTSCGLWNGKLEKFIRSVMVDISEEPNKQTYRVRYADKFELKKSDGSVNSIYSDLLQYAGHLMFKCDIIVPETTWKLSLIHKMFDYDDGCLQDPLETIERMRMNYSHYATSRMQQAGYLMDRQMDDFEMLSSSLEYEFLAPFLSPSAKNLSLNSLDLNCWQKPRHGTLAKLSCASKGNQVKLTGANMLECRPSGWIPLDPSQKPLVKKLIPRDKASSPQPPTRSSRRIVTDISADKTQTTSQSGLERANNDNYDNDDDSTATEVYISSSANESPNDLEESRTTTTTTTILSTEVDFIPTTTPTTALTREGADFTPPKQHHKPTIYNADLTPIQLASLLPSCISTRRFVHPISNRLPLMDEDSTKIRASSSSENQRPTQDKDRSILSFNFSSSGSKSFRPQHLFAFNLFIVTSLMYSISTRIQNHQFAMLLFII